MHSHGKPRVFVFYDVYRFPGIDGVLLHIQMEEILMLSPLPLTRFAAMAGSAIFVIICGGEVGAPAALAASPETVSTHAALPDMLTGLQGRIDAAATSETGSEALEALIADIEAFEPDGAETLAYYRQYWLACAYYRLSIERQRAGRIDDPEPPLQNAISLLKDITPRDGEAHALFALAAGLNLQFVPRWKIMIAIGDVNASLGQALTLTPDNVRALYANAVSDWNTPPEFGGRQRAETYLRQAVAIPAESPHPLAPTWGHDLAHVLLVEILLETERTQEAADLYDAALAKFPDSAEVAALKERF